MNRFILVVFFAIIPVSYCSALTQWGNGDLYSETTADLSYDSNLFLQENDSIDDFLSTFYGGLGYLMAERTVLNVEFELGLEVGRFLDYNTEDYEDWKSKFEISYPNHIESQGFFSFAAGWNQDTQSNADIGQRIEIETKDVDFQSTESISEKLQLEFSIGLVNEDYNNGIDPNDNLALNRSADLSDMGLLAAYQYSEKLSGTFAYQFNDLSYNDDLTEQQGDVFAVGLRGELSPKLTGSVSIGVRNSDLTGAAIGKVNRDDPFYSIDLIWAPREKTTVAISGNSSVVSSVYGDANNRNDIQIQVNETVSDKLSSYAGILYSDNDYEGLLERVDGSLILFAGYFFHFNKHSFWNARIQYEDRSSTVDGLGFDRLFGSIGVSSIW